MTEILTEPVRDASPDIFLREIDLEHLGNVEENREAVEFIVRLTEAPTDAWYQEFMAAYERTPYTLKPPLRIVGDTMHIVYLPRYAGELQGYIDFLALIISRSNTETHRTEELHTSNAQERQKAEFREALKKFNCIGNNPMKNFNFRCLAVLIVLISVSALTAAQAASKPAKPQQTEQQIQANGIVAGAVDKLWLQTDAYWHEGDYPRIAALDRIITEADPQFLEAYATGGWLMESLGRTADAEAYYTLGTRNNPHAEYAFYNLGMFEFSTKKNYPAAMQAFQSAVAQPDADLNDWKMLGHSCEKAGQWDRAVETWEQTKARYPNGLAVDRMLAEALEKRRQARARTGSHTP